MKYDNRFSFMENDIISLIGRKKISIGDLAKKVYGYYSPINANNTVGGAIRRINKKCKTHDLSWFINGVGSGRSGRKVWIERQ